MSAVSRRSSRLAAVLVAALAAGSSNGCGDKAPERAPEPAGPLAGTPPALEEGVAVAIVYDTSGSMAETTKTAAGGVAAKYTVANKALAAIVDRLEAWAKGAAPGVPRRVDAGLFVFDGDGARVAVPMGPLDATALRSFMAGFSHPDGATPLGETVVLAGDATLRSPLTRKHVLVVTDGESNRGVAPAAALGAVRRHAEAWKTSVSSHFIAFDVNAAVFAPVKAEGATLLAASNEAQLNEQLTFLLEKKILLEEEEPPARTTGPGTGK